MKKCIFHSPIGVLLIKEESGKIIGISVLETAEDSNDSSEVLMQACLEISEYFENSRRSFSFPIEMHGTEFQKKVWEKLLQVPYGKKVTYGELARQVGHPSSARAVGNAVRKNPLLLVIPCHRVCRASGKLGGFSAGIERKKILLSLEGIKITEVENEKKL